MLSSDPPDVGWVGAAGGGGAGGCCCVLTTGVTEAGGWWKTTNKESLLRNATEFQQHDVTLHRSIISIKTIQFGFSLSFKVFLQAMVVLK